jgi:L-alanine-DL-glutamate epimerase-like enolase superfamily enzyme
VSTTATIERIEVERHHLPLHSPFATALRVATSVETVVVRVTDSEGRVGLGEAPANWPVLGSSVAGSVACLEGPLTAAVLGRSADPYDAWPLLDRAVRGNTAAKGALDGALHLLAGRPTGALPTVVTVSAGDPDQVAADARARAEEGFGTLKLKVGTDARTDLRRVQAARDGAGPDVALRVDANTGWDAHEAVSVVRALEDAGLGVELVEQPVPAHDLIGMAFVRARVETPVMADESVFDLHDLIEVLRHEAADLVNLKVAKSGGITPALALARAARHHGLGVSVGCMLEGPVGLSAAFALAATTGFEVVPDLDGAWWLAPGAPYAEWVAYADGHVRMGP